MASWIMSAGGENICGFDAAWHRTESPLLCFLKIAGRHGVVKQLKGIN